MTKSLSSLASSKKPAFMPRKRKIVTKADLAWIRQSPGTKAHKLRLLAHMIRIRSNPLYQQHEAKRALHQKLHKERLKGRV